MSDRTGLSLREGMRRPAAANALSVGAIRSRGELDDLWLIDEVAYGPACVPAHVLGQWWERYPNGLVGVRDGTDRVVAGLGLWPLRAKVFRALTDGRRAEADIKAGDFHPDPVRCRRWYASGVVVQPAYRATGALGVMLQGALGEWLSEQRSYPLSIVALGCSGAGVRILERLGFHMLLDADRVPDRQSVHRLDLTSRGEAALRFHTMIGTHARFADKASEPFGADCEGMCRT